MALAQAVTNKVDAPFRTATEAGAIQHRDECFSQQGFLLKEEEATQLDRLEVSAAEHAALLQRLDGQNSAELDNLQRKLDAVYDSTSWRLIGPLRAAVDAERRLGKSMLLRG
jgi:hypothetical protein